MPRLCLYYLPERERDRWIPGDRFVRPLARRVLRGPRRIGGIERVFLNLKLGLERLGTAHVVNLPFAELRADDRVVILGRGRHCLDGYRQPNPIVAGIGLMNHPTEWPTLCDEYPVVAYLQHSAWASAIYRPFFGDRCRIWPVGIDTDEWSPAGATQARSDFLIYDKIHWDVERRSTELVRPLERALERRGLRYTTIRYGGYRPADYKAALARSRAMIFLCEHESQGLAYQECLASGVPVLAWNPGRYLDPARFQWAVSDIPASSVPYWDARCGETFAGPHDFEPALDAFVAGLSAGRYAPRDYIVENLTLEMGARKCLTIVEECAVIDSPAPSRISGREP